MKNTFEMDFIQAIKEAGLEPPDKIVVDGQLIGFLQKEDRVTSRVGMF